jgi:hypothetical protein
MAERRLSQGVTWCNNSESRYNGTRIYQIRKLMLWQPRRKGPGLCRITALQHHLFAISMMEDGRRCGTVQDKPLEHDLVSRISPELITHLIHILLTLLRPRIITPILLHMILQNPLLQFPSLLPLASCIRNLSQNSYTPLSTVMLYPILGQTPLVSHLLHFRGFLYTSL